MSNLWTNASAAAAARICAFSHKPEVQAFTPWSAGFSANDDAPGGTSAADAIAEDAPGVIDPGEIEAEAFAQGFEEGRRTVAMEVAGEREELIRLVEALGVLQPEEPHALGELLAETVDRLVRQIVGEVTIDGTLLSDRAHAAAALIADETSPSRMRLHPDDHLRLSNAIIPVDMIADATIAQGTVLLETGDGWIEDGPDVGLEKLRATLDKLGVPR
jgi:flagellar assembly protein FliH